MDTSETPSTSNTLLHLAPELLQHVLAHLNPADLISFGRTCSTAYDFVAPSNQPLWRESFLQVFDDPRTAWEAFTPTLRAFNAKNESEWDWYHETRRRHDAVRAIMSEDPDERKANYEENVATVLNMIETANRKSFDPKDEESLNISFIGYAFEYSQNTEDFVHDFYTDRESPCLSVSMPRDTPGRPLTRSMVSQQNISDLARRFHILHGLTVRERYSRAAKGAARALVYDWFLTGHDADYGPLNNDGSGTVNWKLLEAVYSVIVRNFELVTDSRIHFPQGFSHNIPIYRGLTTTHDWARVQGPWVGTYSFLDYTDLFHFNVTHRPGFRPALDDHVEACGDLMRLELKLDDTLTSDPRLQTTLPLCHDLPKLLFSGISQGHETSTHNNIISVKGFAALLPDGRSVRWRFIISYGGEDQWQLEGVQPGGPRTGGIFGLWSHCEHEANGPVGPFCYYPIESCPPCPLAQHRHPHPHPHPHHQDEEDS